MSSQTISVAEAGPWLAASPSAGAYWLASLSVPWWIAGGWALDLFAGNQSRTHKDLDVGILRNDALRVLESLAAWEVFEAKNGVLTRLGAGMQPRADVFSLWCRPARDSHWALELMLDEAENGTGSIAVTGKFDARWKLRFSAARRVCHISRPRFSSCTNRIECAAGTKRISNTLGRSSINAGDPGYEIACG